MKRYALAAVLAVVGLALSWSACAGEFSGKWNQYKMVVVEGEESLEVDFDEVEAPEEERGYLEFKDGKIIVVMTGSDDPDELGYKMDGETLTLDLTDEMKADGIDSLDLYFEGDDLVFVIAFGEDAMKNYYKKP